MVITRERYAYLLVAGLAVAVAIVSVLISLQQVRSTNHRFCDMVAISDQFPVARPADSATNKVVHRAYAMFNAYDKFGREIGCFR